MASKGISPTREEDFPAWFQSVVREAEVAELAHVRGSMVIRPWGYAIWELMQAELDREIKASSVIVTARAAPRGVEGVADVERLL